MFEIFLHQFGSFLCCLIILGILYRLKKISFLLKNLGTQKIPMLEKVWSKIFRVCSKTFRAILEFWAAQEVCKG
jgi:hypothetical protein